MGRPPGENDLPFPVNDLPSQLGSIHRKDGLKRKRPFSPLYFLTSSIPRTAKSCSPALRLGSRRGVRPGPAREPRPRGTGRPFCACAARLAPLSAPRTPLPPILKARFSGPSRLGRRGNEVVSPSPDALASRGDSRVRATSQGGPRPAEAFPPGWTPRRGSWPPCPMSSGGGGFACKALTGAFLTGHPYASLRGPFQIIVSLCPPPCGCFSPYPLAPSITRCPWSLGF